MYTQPPAQPSFPEIEKKWLDVWEKEGTVKKYLHKNNDSNRRFSFIDGPITANNPMGVHHGWGRSYKDLWQKFHNLLGEKQRFQNGFDCQGLWVEVEVEKQLGIKNKKDIENLVPGDREASIAAFVTQCRERVEKFAAIQTQQSQRLGYFMDWDHSYFTMSDENNYMIWHFLKVVAEKGWLYKGTESVPWCPRCETAISQHEMLTEDYKEVVHDSLFIQLPIENKKNEYLLVWTTTPWTIPANIAVAVDKKIEYSLVVKDSNKYWIAKERVAAVFKQDYSIEKTVNGEELVGLKYSGPFDDLPAVKAVVSHPLFHTVVATDPLILPITTTEGTGLVHTAVSAGVEDFKLGKKIGLPMIPVIADDATYIKGLGFLEGKNAKKHPELIFDFLKEREGNGEQWIFEIMRYKHRYPACWRCKTELVWKVADEWYIAMDQPSESEGKTYREQMIEVVKTITWRPDFGLDRELDWLKNMHDWLISKKNRYWGLALPIYECKKCNSVSVIGSKEELKERAVSGYEDFDGHTPHKPWIDHVVIKCSKCDEPVHRIDDVGNVWLDAGIVPFSTLDYRTNQHYFREWFPASIVTESFPGQFKNWFYALIAMSTAILKERPFKELLGYATVLDEKGNAMHKSLGNMIEFNEAADKIGVDVMRWLYARQDPTKNLLFGYGKADEVKRAFHLPLWNSLKFFLTYAELDNWKFPTDYEAALETAHLSTLDRYCLARLAETIEAAHDALMQYAPDSASEAIERFVTDLSQWYIRQSRNRIWNNSSDEADKNALYTTLYYVFKKLSVLISPFLPFFSEELHSYLVPAFESVHLSSWPSMPKTYMNSILIADIQKVRLLAEVGHSKRKAEQIKVRQALASATFSIPSSFFTNQAAIPDYEMMLGSELNVKKIIWVGTKENEPSVMFDTTLTPELLREGKLRDMVREIQSKRKELGCSVIEQITLTLPELPQEDCDFIAKKVLAKTVTTHHDASVVVEKLP